MRKTTRIILGLTLVTVLGTPQLQAQLSDNDQITARARIVAPISVTGGADLDFGAVLQGAASLVDANNASSGSFVVGGTDGAGIDLDWTLPTNLQDVSLNNLPIDTYTVIRGDNHTRADPIDDNYATGGTPTEVDFLGPNNYNVFVGAQVTAGGAQPVGLYTGAIDLTVSYNGT